MQWVENGMIIEEIEIGNIDRRIWIRRKEEQQKEYQEGNSG